MALAAAEPEVALSCTELLPNNPGLYSSPGLMCQRWQDLGLTGIVRLTYFEAPHGSLQVFKQQDTWSSKEATDQLIVIVLP